MDATTRTGKLLTCILFLIINFKIFLQPVAEYRSSQSYSSLNQLTPRQPQAESSVGMGQIQQLLTKILRELAKNREDYNALMHKLVSIETKLVNLQDTTSGNNKTKEDMPFPLPITDVADIVPLEDCLKGNKAFYRQLVSKCYTFCYFLTHLKL